MTEAEKSEFGLDGRNLCRLEMTCYHALSYGIERYIIGRLSGWAMMYRVPHEAVHSLVIAVPGI